MTVTTLGAIINSNKQAIQGLVQTFRLLALTSATVIKKTVDGATVELVQSSSNVRSDARTSQDVKADIEKATKSTKDKFKALVANIIKQDTASRDVRINVVIEYFNVNEQVTPQVAVILRNQVLPKIIEGLYSTHQRKEHKIADLDGVKEIIDIQAIQQREVQELVQKIEAVRESIQDQLNQANYSTTLEM